jgi:predicted ester cyclase
MDEMSALVERYLAARNNEDPRQIESLYDEDAERVSPMGTVRGCAAIRAYAERFWRFAPSARHSFARWASQGTVVLYELVYEGVHTGPLATPSGDIVGSGQHFRIAGAGVLEISNGRIAAERIYFDPAQFLSQLGIRRYATSARRRT